MSEITDILKDHVFQILAVMNGDELRTESQEGDMNLITQEAEEKILSAVEKL